jgi:arylformamidase
MPGLRQAVLCCKLLPMPQAADLHDPVYLNAQYNNGLRVPHFMQYLQRWKAASQQLRAQQACLLDVPYGSSAAETLDVFPAAGSKRSVMVFIHGGYWRSLDKADFSCVAAPFTAAGHCVVVPNYALCKASDSITIDDIALQLVRSLVWVHQHIDQYGGDPARITVVGHSAGGHLAAMLLSCLWPQVAVDLPEGLVRNAMGVSGLYDLAPVMHTPYLQADLQLTAAQVRRSSPAYFAPPKGQLMAVCGAQESEEFLRQNRLIEQAWGERVVAVREAQLGLNHFSILDALMQPAHRVHALAQQLLA